MNKKTRIARILKSNSGESLIYVLVIMLFLVIISVSISVAASSNIGYELKQAEHNQVMILSESVHKNIMYSLQSDPSNADLLSRQLVRALYEANDPYFTGTTYSINGLSDIQVSISFSDGYNIYDEGIKLEKITLSFPKQHVIIEDPVPAIYSTEQNIRYEVNEEGGIDEIAETTRIRSAPRIPKTAVIIANMTVTVEVNAKGRITATRAVYEYIGGKLTDDLTGAHEDVEDEDFVDDMHFTVDGYGSWRLVKYENIDSKD